MQKRQLNLRENVKVMKPQRQRMMWGPCEAQTAKAVRAGGRN